MATSTISAPSQALLAASARPKSSSCALPRMPVAILAKIGRAASQLLQPMRPRPDRGMHSITASSLQGVSAAPLLVSIDSASIVHLVAAGCRHRPDLCEAALEVPNCSDATHDGHVAPTSSFTPDPSTASKARPRRRRTQHRAPPASWRPPSCQKRRFSYAYCTTQVNFVQGIFKDSRPPGHLSRRQHTREAGQRKREHAPHAVRRARRRDFRRDTVVGAPRTCLP